MTTNDPPGTYRYELAEGSLASRAIYLAVAEVRGCDPLDLPPLGRTIDTDGVNSLVQSTKDTSNLEMSFEYAGCPVTVTNDEIRIEYR